MARLHRPGAGPGRANAAGATARFNGEPLAGDRAGKVSLETLGKFMSAPSRDGSAEAFDSAKPMLPTGKRGAFGGYLGAACEHQVATTLPASKSCGRNRL